MRKPAISDEVLIDVEESSTVPFGFIMDAIPNLIFVKDEASRFLYANKALLDLYPPEQRDFIIGYTGMESFTTREAEAFLAEDRRALSLGRTEIVETLVDCNGRLRVFHTRKIAFDTAKGERRLLGISDDITDLTAREKHLAALNSHLQDFSALAAHDLVSPLGAITGTLELLKRDRDTTLGAASERRIDLAMATAQQLVEGIRSLLTATRASFSRDALVFAPTDLNVLWEEVQFRLSEQIAAKGAYLTASRLPQLCVEPSLFRQLLQNLLENSLKYITPQQAPPIVLRYDREGDDHVFSLEDCGRGISADAAERVFGLYEQERTAGVTGVGLGLALCKRIVGIHNGRIWVDMAYATGCRIVWTIPEQPALDESTIHAVLREDAFAEVEPAELRP